jgi:hypothetical protein
MKRAPTTIRSAAGRRKLGRTLCGAGTAFSSKPACEISSFVWSSSTVGHWRIPLARSSLIRATAVRSTQPRVAFGNASPRRCSVLGARCSVLGARCSVLGARCSVLEGKTPGRGATQSFSHGHGMFSSPLGGHTTKASEGPTFLATAHCEEWRLTLGFKG